MNYIPVTLTGSSAEALLVPSIDHAKHQADSADPQPCTHGLHGQQALAPVSLVQNILPIRKMGSFQWVKDIE